uniref:hypothetical protein n=1 Tax=uncultured Draconibacterium sp. TaxID=1573823 RepID=UPI0032172879
MALTNAQKAIKARTKIESLELEQNLGNLISKIDDLFNDAPVEVAETTTKQELEELIRSIKAGTATNEKISRFLDIAGKLGL